MIAKDNTTVVAYINNPVVAGSGSVSMATVSRYSHLGQTHSGLPQCNSRWVISVKPAHHNRVESPPQSNESNIQTVGDSSSGHDCHSPQHASAPVYISSSRAMSTGDRCSVTRLAGVVDVNVSTVSPAQQSHSQAQDDAGGEVILIAPWWLSQQWFPHLLRLCVDHSRFFQFRRDLLSQ